MVTWKVVLIVIAIGILLMAIGMWLGYRYISEQDEIRPMAQLVPDNTELTFVLIQSPSEILLR